MVRFILGLIADGKIATIALAAAVCVAMAACGVQTYRLAEKGRELAEVKAGHAESMLRIAEAAQAQADENSRESARRFAEQQEIIDNAIAQRDQNRDAAAAAAAAGDQLQKRFRELTACFRSSTCNPSLERSGTAAGSAGDMLANVLDRLTAAENTIARFADDAYAAGRACENQYDSLKPRLL